MFPSRLGNNASSMIYFKCNAHPNIVALLNTNGQEPQRNIQGILQTNSAKKLRCICTYAVYATAWYHDQQIKYWQDVSAVTRIYLQL